jgi:hemolysin activation/secretion protein
MDIKSIKKTTDGAKTSDDQLRIPYFGFSFSKNDAYGQTSFAPQFNFSTSNFLGASECNHISATRPDSGGSFFKYEQSLNRLQRMPWNSYLSVRSQFQAASHTLPSSEELQLGGVYSIRGYPEGDYLCDIGGYASTDWVMPTYLIPADWKLTKTDRPLRNLIETVLFMDIGGGELKKVASGERPDKFLIGIGCGFRFHLFKGTYLSLQWARPVGDRPVGGSGPSTFYFTFQAEK